MSRYAVLLFVVCILSVSEGYGRAPSSWKITSSGVGPIKFGMTVAQAQRITGYTFEESPERPFNCDLVAIAANRMYSASEMVALWFYVHEGRIVAAEVWDSVTKTDRGVGYKDSESKVRSTYKDQIETTIHTYLNGFSDLYVWSSDRSAAIRFRSNGSDIYVFRAGLTPYVTHQCDD